MKSQICEHIEFFLQNASPIFCLNEAGHGGVLDRISLKINANDIEHHCNVVDTRQAYSQIYITNDKAESLVMLGLAFLLGFSK